MVSKNTYNTISLFSVSFSILCEWKAWEKRFMIGCIEEPAFIFQNLSAVPKK